MGYRLHAATLYKVEYGAGTFNHLSEKINCLLDECPSAQWDKYEDQYSTDVEIDRSDIVTLIHRLRSMDTEEFAEDYGIDGYTPNEVADDLQALLDEADHDNEYIHLSWF